MNLVLTCLALDEDDPILSHVVGWTAMLAGKPGIGRITVISPRVGRYSLPDNVRVRPIGRRNKFATLIAFYRVVFAELRRGVDCFFVFQGGPYPGLLLPVKLITGKPVYQWKAHPLVTRLERFFARYCDTLLFTSTPYSFPIPLPNRRVVGQGIDVGLFRPLVAEPSEDIITVGRVAPVKHLEKMVDLLKRCNERFETSYRLNIYGPTLDMDSEYLEKLKNIIENKGLSSNIVFHGSVSRNELPEILSRHKVFLHFAATALDKTTVEAMACGTVVLSDNPCVIWTFPEHLRARLTLPSDDLDRQVDILRDVLDMEQSLRQKLSAELRDMVIREHNIETFFDKILVEMEAKCV